MNFIHHNYLGDIELEKKVLTHSTVIKYLDGSKPKKVIIVTGKIINVVLKIK